MIEESPTSRSHHRHGLGVHGLLVDNGLLIDDRLMGLLHVGNAIEEDSCTSHGSSSRGNIPATAVMVMMMSGTNDDHWLCVSGRDGDGTKADNGNSSAKGNRENSVAHGSYLKRHPFPKGGIGGLISPRTALVGSVLRILAGQ